MNNLYIGLGGTGIKTVKAIYERREPITECRYHDRYFMIDTDQCYRAVIPDSLQESLFDIGSESPIQIKARALQSPLKRWFVGWYDWYDQSFPLNNESRAERIYGRIGLFGRYEEIYQRLSAIICQSAAELHPEESLKIFIVTGSCGGTGSAIMMDILYMINTILKSGSVPNAERCDNVYLLVAMPEMWIEHTNPDLQYKYVSNAVAFLTELQFAIDNKDTIPSPFYPAVPPKEWIEGKPFSPFQHGYALESRGKTTEQVICNMADLITSLGEGNPIHHDDVHNLAGNVLAEWLQSYKKVSNGNYSFVDWKFARKVLDMDINSDVGTEEIWNRLCNQ